MKEVDLKESTENLVKGTTCANCKFTKDQPTEEVSKEDLNKYGGITPTDETDVKHALDADVITMPGAKFPKQKIWCSNRMVDQWVTERMCCNLWEHPGLIKQFDGKEPKL
jgi:hypothetical protein